MHTSLTRDFDILVNKEKLKLSPEEIKDKILNFLRSDTIVKDFDAVQFGCANPTGPMHLAHLYNCLIGTIYSNLTNAKRIYYVNDFGKKFFKFLKSYDHNISAIENYYNSYRSYLESNILEDYRKKKLTEAKLTPEECKIRDFNVSENLKQMHNIGVNVDQFYYESSYQENILEKIKEFDIEETSEGIFFKNVRLTTSNLVPLYIASDLLYRKETSKKYSKVLQVIGQDNMINSETINSITQLEWEFVAIPALKIKDDKVSSSKGNLLFLEDLENLWKPHLNTSEFKDVLRLWVLFTSSMSKLDIEDKNIKSILDLCKKILKRPKDYSIQDLETIEIPNNELTYKCATIIEILTEIVRKKDLNKLFKLLEYLKKAYARSLENEKIIISLIYNKLLDLILK